MRFLLAVLFGAPLASAVIVLATQGDPFAMSIAIGFVVLFVLQNLAAHMATRPLPRKADPAKIARLERELQIGLRERAEESADERGYTGDVRERWIAGYMADGERTTPGRPARNIVVDTEAPTTVAKPPARRSVYDSDGSLRRDVCWGCGMPATTSNAGWSVCAMCREENVGVDTEGSTRSVARQGLASR